MATDINNNVISKIIYHALLNKHQNLVFDEVNCIVTEVDQCVKGWDSEARPELLDINKADRVFVLQKTCFSTLTKFHDVQGAFYTDVRNQAFVLCIFIISLAKCTVSNNFLEFIFRLLFFQKHIEWRNSHFVSDFGGLVPTTTIEMEQELPSLRKLLIQTAKLADNSKDSQSQALANCYAKIIRLHPFKDGNGRIARIIIEFFLIRWSYEMVIIPKVRNDVTWKKSLISALNGDYHLLSAWFYDRMKKIPANSPEHL